jgi:catechol 2,3-dioxygenase-like lactoylglutathione lyase family enzyme
MNPSDTARKRRDNVDNNLDFVLLHVPDLAAARAFYTEKLGFAVEAENPGFIQFRRPSGAIFALQQDAEGHPYSGVELWWLVPNADQAHDELSARGVPIVAPLADQPFGRTFSVADPAGNTLNVFQARTA